MATKRFLLLVNNIIIRDTENNPILEVQEDGEIYYSNLKGNDNLGSRVDEFIQQVSEYESRNELYEALLQTEPLTRYNQDFNFKMIITPLYELQMQLARATSVSRIAGSHLDVGAVWEAQRTRFIVDEFIKYSHLIDYIEQAIRIKRPKYSPFRITFENNRMMNIIYLKINGLFNPLDTLEQAKNSKLFRKVYDPDWENKPQEPFSLDNPEVFEVDILRATTTCYFSTTSDILALCGINHKEAMTSKNVYRLIAGILMRNLIEAAIQTGGLNQDLLKFPVGLSLHIVVDPDTQESIEYFRNKSQADAFAEENGYVVVPYDTDAEYIRDAFPSFFKKEINETTDLLRMIRGASLVE